MKISLLIALTLATATAAAAPECVTRIIHNSYSGSGWGKYRAPDGQVYRHEWGCGLETHGYSDRRVPVTIECLNIQSQSNGQAHFYRFSATGQLQFRQSKKGKNVCKIKAGWIRPQDDKEYSISKGHIAKGWAMFTIPTGPDFTIELDLTRNK